MKKLIYATLAAFVLTLAPFVPNADASPKPGAKSESTLSAKKQKKKERKKEKKKERKKEQKKAAKAARRTKGVV